MTAVGAPAGNNNAGKNKPFKAALDRALARKSLVNQRDELDRLAELFLGYLDSGESWAWKEFADRLDGKAVQSVANDGDAPFVVRVEQVIVDSPG